MTGHTRSEPFSHHQSNKNPKWLPMAELELENPVPRNNVALQKLFWFWDIYEFKQQNVSVNKRELQGSGSRHFPEGQNRLWLAKQLTEGWLELLCWLPGQLRQFCPLGKWRETEPYSSLLDLFLNRVNQWCEKVDTISWLLTMGWIKSKSCLSRITMVIFGYIKTSILL